MTKKSDIKKTEILKTAQKLFFGLGYENTSVNSIIDELGISKGGFYHHFSSKEQLLTGLIETFADAHMTNLKSIVETKLAPLEKLNRIYQQTQEEKFNQRDTLDLAFQVLFEDQNIKLRTKLKEANFKAAYPLIENITQEGTEKNLFFPASVESASESILVLGSHMAEDVAMIMTGHKKTDEQDRPAEIRKQIKNFELSVMRLLGIKKGFVAINRSLLKKMCELSAHMERTI